MPNSVFECRKCGHCCEGRGGIVLGKQDLKRLSLFLGMSESDFIGAWTETAGSKLRLGSGKDGYCVFFNQQNGCDVHPAKPDVCRAWPFFRGNLQDPLSFAMAKEYCPGIKKNASFQEFSQIGMEHLVNSGLANPSGPANALRLPETDK